FGPRSANTSPSRTDRSIPRTASRRFGGLAPAALSPRARITYVIRRPRTSMAIPPVMAIPRSADERRSRAPDHQDDEEDDGQRERGPAELDPLHLRQEFRGNRAAGAGS